MSPVAKRKLFAAGMILALLLGHAIFTRPFRNIDYGWLKENTTPFKKVEIPSWVTAGSIILNKMGFDLGVIVHPPTNNPVLTDTEKNVGTAKFYEEVRDFHFKPISTSSEEKGEKKKGREQVVGCSISFGLLVKDIREEFMREYDNCDPYIIACFRKFWDQVEAYKKGAGPLPLKDAEGGHAIGRSVDVHRTCMDGRIPLGKLPDGKIVWYGKEPKKGAGLKGIHPDPDTKADVLRWMEEVRFKDKLDELKKLPSFNKGKCLEYAYKNLIAYVGYNLEGVNNVIYEFARERGLTGALCTKARPADAGHYSELNVGMTEDQKDRKYYECSRGSTLWEEYLERSIKYIQKENGENAIGDLFPISRCTD